MNPTTEARRRLVRRLLADEEIHNQEQLRRELSRRGYPVTQATISRDLDAVGAVKVGDGNGGHYAILAGGERASRDRALTDLRRAVGQFVLGVAVADPVVVIRVPPGAAHLVASRVDGADLDGVLGTVAGDDTLLVIADTAVGAHAVAGLITGGGS